MTGQATRVAAMSFTSLKPKNASLLKRIITGKKGPLYAVPKVDGIRCLATTNGLFTKNGIPIVSAFDVQSDVFRVLYREYKDFDPHDIVLDGELYASNEVSLNELLHVMRCNPLNMTLSDLKKQKSIKFHVSDVFFLEKSRRDMPYLERRQHLNEILDPRIMKKLKHVVSVKSSVFQNEKQYEALLQKYIKAGKGGIVVYDPQGIYEPRKRSKMAWKLFPRQSAWFPVCNLLAKSSKRGPMRVQCQGKAGRKFSVPLVLHSSNLSRWSKNMRDLEAKIEYYKMLPSGFPRFGNATAVRKKLVS